jgi:hypothetical protein
MLHQTIRCENHIPAVTALVLGAMMSSSALARSGDEAVDSIRVNERNVSAAPGNGGIAGVSLSENFESGFAYGMCPQNGWGCTQVINHPEPTFGLYSLMNQANGGGGLGSPTFPVEAGQIHTDIIVNDTTSLFQWNAVNNTAGFFNTRLNFETNGTIRPLQVDPACTIGTFTATTGTWTPNVKMRIGIEVLPGNIMRVYQDGAQIFQGQDIAQVCSPASPVGISRVQNFNSNIGNTATMVIDNISQDVVYNPCAVPLPFCNADVSPEGGDNVVGIDDLLTVINTWGQTQNPPGSGPRPLGDCFPLPNGDCLVNIDDLLAVVNAWGTCPVPTGACCIQGACSIQTQTACTGSPNFGTYQGNFSSCAGTVCPVTPPNDLCVNAWTAANGSNAWNNANANFDGPAIPASCFPNGGGARQDVWFRYTATCNGNAYMDTIGTAAPFTDTVLQVFDTWNCNPVGPMLACNDDIDFAGNNWLSRMTLPLLQNQQVLVRCMSQSASPATNQGAAVLNITCDNFDNSTCNQAFIVNLGTPAAGTVQGGQTPTQQPNCLPGGAPLGFGRWYKITGNGSMYTASTCGSPESDEWDGRLVIYCGSDCQSLDCVAASSTYDCGPGGKAGTGTQETVTWCARPSKTYWIYVGADQFPPPPDGGFQLIVTGGSPCDDPNQLCGADPTNDNCVNAIPIFNGTTTFTTVFATTDGPNNTGLPGGVTCSDSGGTQTVNDIWYRYTANATGLLTISTCAQLGGSANYDTDLVLYPGNSPCPPLASSTIACNDDDTMNPCGQAPPWASTLRANVTSGVSYLLRVGGWNNPTDFGTGVLMVTPSETFSCGDREIK